MKKRNKVLICFLLVVFLVSGNSLFAMDIANLAKGNYKFLDMPLIRGMLYFLKGAWTFQEVAQLLSVFLGLISILWCCFKLWFGTYDARKAFVDTFCAILLFTGVSAFYPKIVNGVLNYAMELGTASCGGYAQVTESFSNFYKTSTDELNAAKTQIKKALSDGYTYSGITTGELEKIAQNTGMDASSLEQYCRDNNITKYDHWWDQVGDNIKKSFKKSNDYDLYSVSEARNSAVMNGLGTANASGGNKAKVKDIMARIEALNEIAFENTVDGEGNISDLNQVTTAKSFTYNPFIDVSSITSQDSGGISASVLKGVISPSAVIKSAVLICSVINATDKNAYELKPEDKSDTDASSTIDKTNGSTRISKKNPPSFFKARWDDVVTFLMGVIINAVVIGSAVFFSIQYCMALFEYFIVTAIGYLFIPCILFEGTKSYAAKLVNLFVSFFLKIMVTVMCVYWALSALLWLGSYVMGNPYSTDIYLFVTVLFTCILGLVVTQNAPQVVQTILTGDPKLSMGEFLHAAGTLGAMGLGSMKAAKAASGVAHTGGHAVQGLNRGFSNVAAAFHGANTVRRGGGDMLDSASFVAHSARKGMGNWMKSTFTGVKDAGNGGFAVGKGDQADKHWDKEKGVMVGSTNAGTGNTRTAKDSFAAAGNAAEKYMHDNQIKKPSANTPSEQNEHQEVRNIPERPERPQTYDPGLNARSSRNNRGLDD